MSFGTGLLVAAARKAMFAMRYHYPFLGICNPAMQGNTLVLPIELVRSGVRNAAVMELQESCTGAF